MESNPSLDKPKRQQYTKAIAYDPETRDYAMYLNEELAGFARTFVEAEETLDALIYELLHGSYFTGE